MTNIFDFYHFLLGKKDQRVGRWLYFRRIVKYRYHEFYCVRSADWSWSLLPDKSTENQAIHYKHTMSKHFISGE